MKVREFFTGTEAEKAAITKLNTREDRPLSMEERAENPELLSLAARFRGRQIMTLAAGVGLVMATYFHEENEVLTKEEITISSNRPEHENPEIKTVEEFTVGALKFIRDPLLSVKEFERVKTLLSKAYPLFDKYLPLTEIPPKTITLTRATEGYSSANYSEGKMKVKEGDSDGLIIHELIHIFHGNNDLFHDLIEEGIPTALSKSNS